MINTTNYLASNDHALPENWRPTNPCFSSSALFLVQNDVQLMGSVFSLSDANTTNACRIKQVLVVLSLSESFHLSTEPVKVKQGSAFLNPKARSRLHRLHGRKCTAHKDAAHYAVSLWKANFELFLWEALGTKGNGIWLDLSGANGCWKLLFYWWFGRKDCVQINTVGISCTKPGCNCRRI